MPNLWFRGRKETMKRSKRFIVNVGSNRLIRFAAAIAVAWLFGGVFATSGPMSAHSTVAFEPMQAAPQQRPQMVEEVFKNIQVLKGISVDDFMGTMGVMSIALGYCCSDCHTNAGTVLVKWEADTPRKNMARRMTQMVQTINRDNFGGRQVVTCWSCHRGRDKPMVTPTLDFAYGTVNPDRDDQITQAPGMATPDQVIDKYIQAIGGAQRVNAITSYSAKGMSTGFGGLGGGGQ